MSKLTQKQENFCKKYIQIGNASEAYRQCYEAKSMGAASINEEAYRLLKNPVISLRIEELREISSQKHLVTVRSLTEELEEARQLANRKEEASPMISASMGKAKLHGLLVDKAETKQEIEVKEKYDDKELARRLAFILASATIKPE